MEKLLQGSFYCGSYWRGIAKFNNKMRLADKTVTLKWTILRKEMRQLLLKASGLVEYL
jgi:hypothetical protein